MEPALTAFFLSLMRFLASLALNIVGPFVLVAAGGLVMFAGLALQWSWLVYCGAVIATLGVLLILRLWQLGD